MKPKQLLCIRAGQDSLWLQAGKWELIYFQGRMLIWLSSRA